jgi:hypothetical protein
MRFVLYILLLLPSAASAHDDWTTGDTVRQGVVTALLVVDWGQTRWIVKNPTDPVRDGTYNWRAEANPILGSYPSIGKVNTYFTAAIIGHAAVSYFLPRGWRDGWQYVWIGAEINQIAHNRSMGIKIAF